MKKILQTLMILSLLPIAAIGQTTHLTGTVIQDDQPVANANVYAMVLTPAFADTIGTAVTNTEGIYGMDLPLEANDSLIVWLSTDACPDTMHVFFLAGPQNGANLSCDNQAIMQQLFIGAQSISEDGLEWFFASSITSGVANYLWNIDGQIFSTETVDYVFPEAGQYEVSLSVLLNSGNFYSTSLLLTVGDTGSGAGPMNCQSLFYPLTDSVADGFVFFVNSSLGSNLTYFWDFGDGTSSTDAYPTHTYADDETMYTVCLTITGDDCEQEYCAEVSGGLDGSGLIVNGKPQKDLTKSGTFEFVVIPVYSGPTGVIDEIAPLEFTLFPNPTTGNVTIKLDIPASENGAINITDITGKIVVQQPVSGIGSLKTITLNMDKLANGTYLLQYEGNSISKVQKVILQR